MKQITLVILALHAEDGNKLRLRKVWNSGLLACIIQAPLLCVPEKKERKIAPYRDRTYDLGVISTTLYRLS